MVKSRSRAPRLQHHKTHSHDTLRYDISCRQIGNLARMTSKRSPLSPEWLNGTFATLAFLALDSLLSYLRTYQFCTKTWTTGFVPKLGPHYQYHISCRITQWSSHHDFFDSMEFLRMQNYTIFLACNEFLSISHGRPTTIFFNLWSSYVCRIIRCFWLVMNS